MTLPKILLATSLLCASAAHAQSVAPTTLVIVPAHGEVTAPNDQAVMTLMVEEQDKDKAAAASRVNQKMKQGTEIVRAADPHAELKTQGYYSYPIYPEQRPLPNGAMAKQVPTGWRVGQYLQVKTTNLASLPKTAAAAQKVLALSSVDFGLTPSTTRKLDQQRIAATYQNLNERIASMAAAMGRKTSDTFIETIDFEGSGNYASQGEGLPAAPAPMMRAMKGQDSAVSEPSFEPGETTLDMRLVGRVKFK
ncbi:MAG: SIMPL domain-containing protein [Massilia sp.]